MANILDAVGPPPDSLELEVTESVLLERSTTISTPYTLWRCWRSFSLDDSARAFFLGVSEDFPSTPSRSTGISSKTSKQTTRARPLSAHHISLAHGLGCESWQRGVENAAQLTGLRRRGCDRLQGNLLSVPMPPNRSRHSFAIHPWRLRRRAQYFRLSDLDVDTRAVGTRHVDRQIPNGFVRSSAPANRVRLARRRMRTTASPQDVRARGHRNSRAPSARQDAGGGSQSSPL